MTGVLIRRGRGTRDAHTRTHARMHVCTHTHRRKAMWGQSKSGAICKPKEKVQEKPHLPTSWSWTSSLQNWEKRNPHYLSPPVQFSHSVVSNSLWPHEPQHTRPSCPSPTPRVYPSSFPLSQMPSNYLILCHPVLLLPSIFPTIRVFSNESALCIRWPKY